MVGETISHYRILEELGRGGMGVVYVAEDVKLGRRVALKVLAPEVADNHDRVQRFIREARAASAINHPNIATIHEIDEVNGTTFIAMELVEGETLREKIVAGIPSCEEILDLAKQIARALGSAHEKSIIHRDVKPENIVVRPDGLVKVLDFGLAKLLPQPESATATMAMSLTREGAVMGTAQYMAPEQAQGQPVDARADVFAAGAVLQEMVTGKPAFSGDTHIDVLYSIINKPPRPIPEDSGAPRELRDAISKALSKNPDDRFDDCCAFAEALETGWVGDSRTVIHRASPTGGRNAATRTRRLAQAAAVVVVAALAVVGLRMWTGRGGDLPDPSNLTYTPLTGDGHSRSSAISPDGMYLAYTPMDGEESGLFLKQIDTGSESVLVPRGPYGIRSPIFSPDGNLIYYAMMGPTFSMSADAEYDLYRISMLGGEPLQVATGIIGRRFAMSPDGTRLAYKRAAGDSTKVFVSDAIGASEREIAAHPRSLTVDCCVAWCGGSDAVVTSVRDTTTGLVSLVTLPLDDGPARCATDQLWQAVLDIHTLADGAGLLVVGCPVSDEKVLNINLWHIPSTGAEPGQITNDITNYYQVSSSAAGDKLALTFYAAKRTLLVVDANTGESTEISTDVVSKGKVAWASPGRVVTNQRVGNRIGLVTMDLATGTSDQVVTNVDYVSELDVSPDGQLVAFTSFEGSGFTLWQVALDGSAPRPLAAGDGDEMDACFSPDGAWMAAMHRSSADAPWTLRRRTLGTEESQLLCEVSGRWPRVSPDGLRVVGYFLDEDTSRYRLALVPSDGGEPEFLSLAGPYTMLDWTPEGQSLTCYRREGASMIIDDVPLDGGPPAEITVIPPGSLTVTDADWNATGDSLAVCLQSATFDVTLVQGL